MPFSRDTQPVRKGTRGASEWSRPRMMYAPACAVSGSIETTASARSRMRFGAPCQAPRHPMEDRPLPPGHRRPEVGRGGGGHGARLVHAHTGLAPSRLRVEGGDGVLGDPLRLVEHPHLVGRVHRAAEARAEEGGAHEAQPRVERARVERKGPPIVGERSVRVEGECRPSLRSLVPTRVVGVAGRDRLGCRRPVGRRRRWGVSVPGRCLGPDRQKKPGRRGSGVPDPLHDLREGRPLPVHQDAHAIDPRGDPHDTDDPQPEQADRQPDLPQRWRQHHDPEEHDEG